MLFTSRSHCVQSLILACTAIVIGLPASPQKSVAAEQKQPLKVLLITGGCCHDYEFQSNALKQAFSENGIQVEWTVVNEGGNGTKAQIDLYDDPDWGADYDVVIHNECFANTASEDYIRRITQAHKKGVNAVVIHCAMHTYRASKIDEWRKFLGVTSRRHDHQANYPVRVVEPNHPIMQDFPEDWVTPKDELYIIEAVWPTATPLATAVSQRDGSSNACFWINRYGKSRVFGTTFGHGNATFADEDFRSVIVKGALWAAGNLEQAEPNAP